MEREFITFFTVIAIIAIYITVSTLFKKNRIMERLRGEPAPFELIAPEGCNLTVHSLVLPDDRSSAYCFFTLNHGWRVYSGMFPTHVIVDQTYRVKKNGRGEKILVSISENRVMPRRQGSESELVIT